MTYYLQKQGDYFCTLSNANLPPCPTWCAQGSCPQLDSRWSGSAIADRDSAAMAQASALSWRPFGDIIRASAKLNWPLASPILVFHLIQSERLANTNKYRNYNFWKLKSTRKIAIEKIAENEDIQSSSPSGEFYKRSCWNRLSRGNFERRYW